MVTQEKFIEVVKEIRLAYNTPTFLDDLDKIMSWYKHFKDCNEWSFVNAVDKTLQECYRLPVIADIYNRYDAIEKDRKHNVAEFKYFWRCFVSDYPGGNDYENDWDSQVVFKKLTVDKVGGDYAKGLELAKRYRDEMNRFVNGKDKLPSFPEYLKGLE